MYNSKVIDTFVNSVFIGDVKGASTKGTYKSKINGDILKISLKIEQDLTISKVGFKAFGGVVLTAYTHALCEIINGKPLKVVKEVSAEQLLASVKDMPQEKNNTAEFVAKAYKELVKKYTKRIGLNL